jgi:PleD family two-component response regulator
MLVTLPRDACHTTDPPILVRKPPDFTDAGICSPTPVTPITYETESMSENCASSWFRRSHDRSFKGRVLIVDNNEDALARLGSALAAAAYATETTWSGVEALNSWNPATSIRWS